MYAVSFDKNGNLESTAFNFADISDVSFIKELHQRIKKLESIYSELPETICNNCGKCCSQYRTINVYSIEFFYIKEFLNDKLLGEVLDRIKVNIFRTSIDFKKIRDFYPTNLCPFLNKEKKCIIYPRRPFTCRAYGLRGVAKSKDCVNQICSKQVQCKSVKLLESTYTEWNCCETQTLRSKIEKLSDYYFIDRENNQIFNRTNIQNWLCLSLFQRL